MTAFIVSIVVYFFGLWLGKYLLRANDLEFPAFSRWLILNTFALVLAYIATLPF
jgi:hypothetical protein